MIHNFQETAYLYDFQAQIARQAPGKLYECACPAEACSSIRSGTQSVIVLLRLDSQISGKHIERVVKGGDFGEGAGAVGRDEGVAEVLKDSDVISGGSAFAKATA